MFRILEVKFFDLNFLFCKTKKLPSGSNKQKGAFLFGKDPATCGFPFASIIAHYYHILTGIENNFSEQKFVPPVMTSPDGTK